MTTVVASKILAHVENLVTNKQFQAFHLRVPSITLVSTNRRTPTGMENMYFPNSFLRGLRM